LKKEKNKNKKVVRMLDTILKEAEEKMAKSVENTKDKFSHVRAGRASVSMLDGVTVEAYGSPTPLNQVGTVSAPEARLLVIDPWDKSLIPVIEKTILQANLGFNPSNDGKVIRLVVPELTEDRRKEYVKMVKKEAEEGKVAIRNVRKDINNKLRKLEKDSEITEVIERYRGLVPKEMLEIWEKYGLGSFMNGYLRVINPNDYKKLVEETYFRGNKAIPIFITAFADIVTWEENEFIGMIRKPNCEITTQDNVTKLFDIDE